MSHTPRSNGRVLIGFLFFSAFVLATLFSPGFRSAAAAPQAAPLLDGISPNPVPRSGLVRITGTNFGPQGGGQLAIDGKPSQHVAQWTDNLIVAYVPESSSLGDVTVSVTTAAGTGNARLNVTTRPADGRIRWRFTVASGHTPRRPAVGPDGTVYLNDVLGRLYALSPDGGLKWVFQAGLVGARGPVSVGADGTIYVGGLVPKNPATPCEADRFLVNVEGVFAVRPDGTRKWLFDKTCDGLLSGPNVGPDGNIHAVTDAVGIGAFALNPEGTLAHAPTGRFGVDGDTGTEIVFGPAAPGEAPTQKYFQYESGGLFGYTLAGQRVFLYGTNAVGITQPVAGQRTGTVYTMPDQQTAGRLFAVSPQGALRWVSPIRPIHSLSIPDAPPSESAVYVVQDGAKLHRVNPADGSVVWTFIDNFEQLFDPVASPDDRLVLMGGQANYGQPGFFEAVSNDGRQLWKQHLPDEANLAPYGQVVPRYRARFTDDGQAAYIAAHVAGADYSATIPAYSFFYALDTSDNGATINQPPTASVVSPVSNLNVPLRTQLDIKVRAEDDGAVARVEFFYGQNGTRTQLGTDTTPDADGLYGVQFTPPGPGVYSFFAQAYDAAGLRGDSQSVTVTVSNQAPTISWVEPANNASFVAPASVTLTARAADSDGTVAIVHFNSSQIGDIGQDTTADAEGNYQVVWSNPPQGTHELAAWATDNDGTRRAATITITVGPPATPTPTPTPVPTPAGAAPAVSITSPADRASFAPGANVAVTADASDSDGRVARVEFWYEGFGGPAATDTAAPYAAEIRWPGPTALKLYAVAYDDAGNRTQSAPVLIYFEDPAGNLTVAGRITHQQSSPSNPVYLSNALVKLGLNNQPLRATRTDANGYYTFTGLSRGGAYKVEPAEPGYTFYPPAVFYGGLIENATRDFVAEGPLPAGPAPTPTPGANGLAWERIYNSPHDAADGGALVATDAQGGTYVAGTSYAPAGGDSNITLVKYGPDGAQLWQREYAGRADGRDWATAVRVDSEGNVYVSGTAWGGAAYEYDVVTIKYAADGTELWARAYNGPLGRWDTSVAMEIDNAGNVITGGYSQAGDAAGRLYDEFVVIKYNPSGVAVWERRHSTDARGDRLVSLAVDSARNVYATGGASVAAAGGPTFEDIITVKYGPDGTRLWASRFNRAASTAPLPDPLPGNPASRAHAGGAALDPSTGDLYVFGTSEFGPTGTDYLLLKYNSATGDLRWNRNWSGPRADAARSLAVDARGNAYLTGESYDGDFESATSVRSADVATVKFAPGGAVLWERLYRGFPGKTDAGRRLAVDAAGDAYIAFYSEGFVNTDTGVVKYGADGAEQWVYRYDNPAHTSDQVSDLALDAAGHLYVAGSASAPNAAGAQATDIVVFKLAPVSAAINAAPEVSASVQGAAEAGSLVTIAATASDRDGAVSRVDFFDGTAQIGTDTAAPFAVGWSPAEPGAHAITALATDDKGAARTSKTQIVSVVAAPQTFSLSGRVARGEQGLAGVTVTLSGDRAGTAATDAQGNYSFAGLPGGAHVVVTPSLANHTFSPASQALSVGGERAGVNFAAAPVPGVVRFDAPSYQFSEEGGRATVTVVRTGDTSGAASVLFQTVDDPEPVPCATVNGRAYARCDYATTVETLSWAVGDAQPKTVTIPLVDDSRVEGAETIQIRLSSLKGDSVGDPGVATFTIQDNEPAAADNPISGNRFFVRQHYLDFLSREPEAGEPWTGILDRCGQPSNTDATSPYASCDRLLVSESFFRSPEFYLKGLYSYLFYRVAFDRRPAYEEIIPDMRSLAGATPQEVFAKRAEYAASVLQRPEFIRLYSQVSNEQYVAALLGRYGLAQVTTEDPADFEGAGQVTLTRQQMIDALNGNTLSRAQVLRAVVQSNEVDAAEYHGAFVAMQYYGYLRRTPEQSGYDAWLRVIKEDPNNIRGMVNGFVNSQEYRLRFGTP